MKKQVYVRTSEGVKSVVAAIVMVVSTISYAGMNVPVMVGLVRPALNEQGQRLSGAAHLDASSCDLVQILLVGNGIHPPQSGGEPHADNELVAVTHIGNLASSALDNPAVFAYELLSDGADLSDKQIFVRLFNAPELDKASFYGDSEPVSVNSDRVLVDISTVNVPLYVEDSDSDGLLDSWEMSYNTDKYDVDTDGDGMSDFDEVRVGVDPADGDSQFQLNVSATGMRNHELRWTSKRGIQYVVEYMDGSLGEDAPWAEWCEVDGADSETVFQIADLPDVGRRYYRIKVRD